MRTQKRSELWKQLGSQIFPEFGLYLYFRLSNRSDYQCQLHDQIFNQLKELENESTRT